MARDLEVNQPSHTYNICAFCPTCPIREVSSPSRTSGRSACCNPAIPPLLVPLFRSQIGKFFLQGKQGIAVPLALQRCTFRLLLFGQGLHRLVKFPSDVRPARRRMLHIPCPAASGRANSFRRASSPTATRSAGLAVGFLTPPHSLVSGSGCIHTAQSGVPHLRLSGTATLPQGPSLASDAAIHLV